MNSSRTEYAIVAFIDILGAKKKICEETLDIGVIRQLYENALSEATKQHGELDFSTLKIKIFSDNILIVEPLLQDVNSNLIVDNIVALYNHFCKILAFAGMYQNFAIEHGILVRGGISMGEIYLDDIFVWGKALVEAAELEKKARVPIIVFAKNLEFIARNMSYEFGEQKILLPKCLKLNDEKVYFIDYARAVTEGFEHLVKNSKTLIKKDKIYIEDAMNKEEKQVAISINEKLNWHENYIIQECKNRGIDYFNI